MEIVSSKAIHICLGAIASTPVSVLLGEAGEMPLSLRWEFLKMKYWARAIWG